MRLRSECVRERGVGDTHLNWHLPEHESAHARRQEEPPPCPSVPPPSRRGGPRSSNARRGGPRSPKSRAPSRGPRDQRSSPPSRGGPRSSNPRRGGPRSPKSRGPSRGPRDQRSSPPPVPVAVTPDDVNEQRAGWRWAVAVREGGRPHGFEEARRTRSIAGGGGRSPRGCPSRRGSRDQRSSPPSRGGPRSSNPRRGGPRSPSRAAPHAARETSGRRRRPCLRRSHPMM